MKQILFPLTAIALAVAGIAHAKGERSVPEAAARAEAMQHIAADMKVIGEMASGKSAFDAALAKEAQARLVATSAGMKDSFAAPGAADPASEAAPEIWTNWDDFLAKATAMQVAAEAMDASTPEGLQAGMGALGPTCKACHSVYRN